MPRFSDNCAGQFKSRFTMSKLISVKNYLSLSCSTVDWIFYEPDHGEMLPSNELYAVI